MSSPAVHVNQQASYVIPAEEGGGYGIYRRRFKQQILKWTASTGIDPMPLPTSPRRDDMPVESCTSHRRDDILSEACPSHRQAISASLLCHSCRGWREGWNL